MINNFTRAGEKTKFIEYSFDFKEIGVPGLKTSTAYLQGRNIKTIDNGRRKEWERDFRLDYTVQSGLLKGIVLSWRNAVLHSQVTNNIDQNRFVVSFDVELL